MGWCGSSLHAPSDHTACVQVSREAGGFWGVEIASAVPWPCALCSFAPDACLGVASPSACVPGVVCDRLDCLAVASSLDYRTVHALF
jgi:hypothetical protein